MILRHNKMFYADPESIEMLAKSDKEKDIRRLRHIERKGWQEIRWVKEAHKGSQGV